VAITFRFERDRFGFRRAVVEPPFELVGRFLEQDIQGCLVEAAGIIGVIDGVAAGRVPGWEGAGNAFHLSLGPGGARIECLWDDSLPACVLSLEELRSAVGGWAEFISSPEARWDGGPNAT
jgi:hypothetical protein